MLEAGEALNSQVKKSVVWYKLYTAKSPQSFRIPPETPPMSVNQFIQRIIELESSIIGNVEGTLIKLSTD